MRTRAEIEKEAPLMGFNMAFLEILLDIRDALYRAKVSPAASVESIRESDAETLVAYGEKKP